MLRVQEGAALSLDIPYSESQTHGAVLDVAGGVSWNQGHLPERLGAGINSGTSLPRFKCLLWSPGITSSPITFPSGI